MLGSLFKLNRRGSVSDLFNEQTFFKAFEQDITSAKKEIIIESPFITVKRTKSLFPYLESARKRGVKIIINTRDPIEHDDYMKVEAEQGLDLLNDLDVTILYTGKLHRKLAIIDREIAWNGSLNMLSQNDSCEIVQRIVSSTYPQELIRFIGINRYL